MICVEKKTTNAQATVVFRLLVGDLKPGTSPSRLHPRMKSVRVPIKGKYWPPLGPTIVSRKPRSVSTRNSRIFCKGPGTRCSLLVAMKQGTTKKIMTTQAMRT
jgi:hypothetical protein